MSENRTKVRLLQKQVWRKGLVSIRVTKPEGFTFTPGQFVRLGLDIEENGKTEYAARGYSIASVPSDPFLEFFIVEVPQGLVSPRLCALEAGSELWLEPIFGAPCCRKDFRLLKIFGVSAPEPA